MIARFNLEYQEVDTKDFCVHSWESLNVVVNTLTFTIAVTRTLKAAVNKVLKLDNRLEGRVLIELAADKKRKRYFVRCRIPHPVESMSEFDN